MPFAIPTEWRPGRGITRPPRNLCRPGSSASTTGSMYGWPRIGGPVQAEPRRCQGRHLGRGVLLQGLGEADGVPPPRGPRRALPQGPTTWVAGPGVLRPAAARGPQRLPPRGRLQQRPPPLRPRGVGPGLADGHLRCHVRGCLRLRAGREAEGLPPGPGHRRLHYASGTLPTTLGPLRLQSGGFMLTGIPLVMGEHPSP